MGEGRLAIYIKSDSKSALALAELLKVGPSASLIGQELALIYHEAGYEPKVEHLPGVANQLADILSRLNDPKKSNATIPQYWQPFNQHRSPPVTLHGTKRWPRGKWAVGPARCKCMRIEG